MTYVVQCDKGHTMSGLAPEQVQRDAIMQFLLKNGIDFDKTVKLMTNDLTSEQIGLVLEDKPKDFADQIFAVIRNGYVCPDCGSLHYSLNQTVESQFPAPATNVPEIVLSKKRNTQKYTKDEVAEILQNFMWREGYKVKWLKHLSEEDLLNLVLWVSNCRRGRTTIGYIGFDRQRFNRWSDIVAMKSAAAHSSEDTPTAN